MLAGGSPGRGAPAMTGFAAALYQNLPFPVLIVDAAAHVVSYNDAAARTFGFCKGGRNANTAPVIDGADASGVSYARAVALLGVTDVALIDEMTDALAAGDGAAAFATVDRVADAGHDPRRFAADLLERFRDLIIMQRVPDAATNGIIDGPADQLERMTAQATRMGPAALSRML